jgi:hypothetical protein
MESTRSDSASKFLEHDSLRSRENCESATLLGELMEKDRTVLSLRQVVQTLEDNHHEMRVSLEEKNLELVVEQDNNCWLRDLIDKVKTKDETTEEILVAL